MMPKVITLHKSDFLAYNYQDKYRFQFYFEPRFTPCDEYWSEYLYSARMSSN